jgi:hypothetical protein
VLQQGPSKEAGNKSDQQQPIKVGVPEVKETEKQLTSFSLEHEINKIKIPIPLLELMKTESFRKSIPKVLQPSAHVTFSNTINLEDENPAIIVGPHIEDLKQQIYELEMQNSRLQKKVQKIAGKVQKKDSGRRTSNCIREMVFLKPN